jgi:hypothetical protein
VKVATAGLDTGYPRGVQNSGHRFTWLGRGPQIPGRLECCVSFHAASPPELYHALLLLASGGAATLLLSDQHETARQRPFVLRDDNLRVLADLCAADKNAYAFFHTGGV